MKIIYNKYLPTKRYAAINLFGVVFARKEHEPLKESLKHHETIHTVQGKELLWVFFYLFYLLEWLFRLIQYRNLNGAYRNISFEREAYGKQDDLDYLKTRKRYSFVKYLKIK